MEEKMKKPALLNQKGFTLIEILIILILLGILATIIIPQIKVSSEDAKLNALKVNLENIRSAIELYYNQHGNRHPGQYNESDGTTATADAISAADAFIAQLTQYSDANGKTSPDAGSSIYIYGPYLRDGLPVNPFNSLKSVTCDIDATSIVNRTAVPGDGTGWKFYTQTGILIANDDTDHDDF